MNNAETGNVHVSKMTLKSITYDPFNSYIQKKETCGVNIWIEPTIINIIKTFSS